MTACGPQGMDQVMGVCAVRIHWTLYMYMSLDDLSHFREWGRVGCTKIHRLIYCILYIDLIIKVALPLGENSQWLESEILLQPELRGVVAMTYIIPNSASGRTFVFYRKLYHVFAAFIFVPDLAKSRFAIK